MKQWGREQVFRPASCESAIAHSCKMLLGMGQRIVRLYQHFGLIGLIEWRRIRQLGYRHIGGEILGDNFDGKLGGVICWWYDDRHARIDPIYRLGVTQAK